MKKLLIIFISLIVLLLVVSALMPKDFRIEKQITINESPAKVYNYLRMLSNGDEWSPWMGKDKEMTKEFKGTDGEVGALIAWSGNKEVGVGEEEITGLKPNERIEFELRFKKPMKTTNQGYFALEPLSRNQTKLTWVMTGETPIPFNMMCFFMKKQVEKDFITGLENIKRILEK